MRAPFKGLNRIRKRMADGSFRTYFYAWKGGPRLQGEFGSPEFHASYAEAWASRFRARTDTLQHVFDQFRASPDFSALAPRTQKDYSRHLLALEKEFGDLPLVALEDRRVRGDIHGWRDRLAAKSRRQADYAFAILARTLSWAKNRGMVTVNPCERGGRVYRPDRSGQVWTFEQEAAFTAVAPPHISAALTLALWTGQRQGDLLRLRWLDYRDGVIRLRQRKTGMRVEIPVAPALVKVLEHTKPTEPNALTGGEGEVTILRTERGTPWTEGGFRASWRKACKKAGIEGLSFHDLRGTAVTRLAQAGCSVPESATITRHSLKDVAAILDSYYLNRDPTLAKSAITKLTRFADRQPPPLSHAAQSGS
ncbi:tyrosine-type recombinase/integrase [Parafrankia sp. BMG5.11]|uniref:tyrosine-type recombinase/integrase n=1 Tax=Parafrankia sp. BMG5.11 TaxID=222540 RepID=UPI00103A29F6|nr:site-specific integrase [Parafrankia sp. BMG5.11]TCJ39095.1 integrase [Parafrankia sp. BMG5.11]